MRLNKIQQSFTNMKSINTEIKLAIPELHTESAMVSEPSPPDQKFWATLNLGVIELPKGSINGRKKGTEYCGSDILRVIRIRG